MNMEHNEKQLIELHSLLDRFFEGEATQAEVNKIQEIVKNDVALQKYYFRYVELQSGLHQLKFLGASQSLPVQEYDKDFAMLAEYEKTAPTLEIEPMTPEKKPVEMLKIEKTPRVINKFSLYSAFLSAAAAIIFVLVYIALAPKAASTVATITDAVNVQWEQGGRTTDIGGRLWNNEDPRWLKKGTIKIAFDYGAEVIIEGPAEFKMESPEKMHLYSGRLYAVVPKGATGFTVQTPYSTVIDLGTEFGVKVDFDGSTDVHMFKGKASLIPGSVKEKKEGVELTAGQAKAVLQTGIVQEIEFEERLFVRRLESREGFIWRGQSLNLADIVGGGNGFGTGKQGWSIDPVTGEETSDFVYMSRQGKGKYITVENLTYVDGVFVPDGGNGPIQVSSDGILFEGCVDTSGQCYRNIANGFRKGFGTHQFRGLMNGIEYGTVQKPAISMHSNTGLTFDLDEIRKGTPGVKITAFDALCGISGRLSELRNFQATFYILVDGEKRFETTGLHKELLDIPVTIELSESDRFLTLIAADGGDGCPSDWCTFAMPSLELELIR